MRFSAHSENKLCHIDVGYLFIEILVALFIERKSCKNPNRNIGVVRLPMPEQLDRLGLVKTLKIIRRVLNIENPPTGRMFESHTGHIGNSYVRASVASLKSSTPEPGP